MGTDAPAGTVADPTRKCASLQGLPPLSPWAASAHKPGHNSAPGTENCSPLCITYPIAHSLPTSSTAAGLWCMPHRPGCLAQHPQVMGVLSQAYATKARYIHAGKGPVDSGGSNRSTGLGPPPLPPSLPFSLAVLLEPHDTNTQAQIHTSHPPAHPNPHPSSLTTQAREYTPAHPPTCSHTCAHALTPTSPHLQPHMRPRAHTHIPTPAATHAPTHSHPHPHTCTPTPTPTHPHDHPPKRTHARTSDGVDERAAGCHHGPAGLDDQREAQVLDVWAHGINEVGGRGDLVLGAAQEHDHPPVGRTGACQRLCAGGRACGGEGARAYACECASEVVVWGCGPWTACSMHTHTHTRPACMRTRASMWQGVLQRCRGAVPLRSLLTHEIASTGGSTRRQGGVSAPFHEESRACMH